MKRLAKYGVLLSLVFISGFLLYGCNDTAKASATEVKSSPDLTKPTAPPKANAISKEFKSYWYAGEAEVSSFELELLRYGELRKGHAVQVFVTEPFLAEEQVKANYSRADNIPVLKLNNVKKFLTGIYPYSIMTSTFSPVRQPDHALKVTNSVQEWCGQVYTQINNRDVFEVVSHSYFEGEADQSLSLEKAVLEDELWNLIRLRPETLPTGNFKAIPSLEYLRLNHKKITTYSVTAKRTFEDGRVNYMLNYPELGRSLQISYALEFPHQIEGWTESLGSRSGGNARTITSTARRIKTIKTPYWQKNSNRDVILRDSLGLPQ
ncbi:septum formation inhibitor Maf [Lentiprolixibacter aurantiacus]|uniref:Septum formation inhibitor Maf n=1 Tax=Lentiprolixibacter aurantiacus TaxID=2993939 RepID=A0AAE3MMU6_9FLAO|nr:septum formation inhibitor Maf [Lentiprolixibacter aurantiacus]MCX2719784.1 septum formation inhibitor Maf [Lentiprolixibacter aurantiacus]